MSSPDPRPTVDEERREAHRVSTTSARSSDPVSDPVSDSDTAAATDPATDPDSVADDTPTFLARLRARAELAAAWITHVRGDDGELDRLRLALDGFPDRHERNAFLARPELASFVERARAADARRARDRSALTRAADALGLDAIERDTLDAVLALVVAPELGALFALLQGERARTYVTEPLLRVLFDHPPGSLRADSRLVRWKLIHRVPRGPGEPDALELDSTLVPTLLGRADLDPILAGRAGLVPPLPPLPSWPVDALAEDVTRLLRSGRAVRVHVVGPSLSGRRTFAASVAAKLGRRLLAVESEGVPSAELSELHLRAQRRARLADVALAWSGPILTQPTPLGDPSVPLTFAIHDASVELPESHAWHELRVTLPTLSLDERARLFAAHVPLTRGFDRAHARRFAATHRLLPGEIAAVAARAPADEAELARAAREHVRRRMGALGQLVETVPSLDHVILAPPLEAALADFVEEARGRVELVEETSGPLLFPRGAGLVALFAGPPGTGKTLAASAVAGALGLDLVRIDLAALVSKYVGETAKNLRLVFARAAHMHAVLFFDEADACFAKRTELRDAHDRHANADTSYLLTLLEEYRGLAILATNQRTHLDPAVVRRIRHVIELTRPERAERERLFRRLLEDARVPIPEPLETLASVAELSGAQIRDAVLTAMLRARRDAKPLGTAHLLAGVERELQKEGRGLRPEQREKVLHA